MFPITVGTFQALSSVPRKMYHVPSTSGSGKDKPLSENLLGFLWLCAEYSRGKVMALSALVSKSVLNT